MMVGFCYWVMADSVEKFTQIWSLVAIAFVTVVLIGIFFGVRNKIRIERQMIQKKLRLEREKLKKEH
jgi:low affinity Fe/Cu permease